MYISRIALKNWRNFRNVDVKLSDRVFIVGPNASGKSNFLDALRFLRDLAKPGGGLEKAVSDRGGLIKIRCLAARSRPNIELDLDISGFNSSEPVWRYSLGLKSVAKTAYLTHEKVWNRGTLILNRPDKEDNSDSARKTQTHLEQINANYTFRDIADFFATFHYIHLIPQLLRQPSNFTFSPVSGDDPFGINFLYQVLNTNKKTRDSRLKKINNALKAAVPQFTDLTITQETVSGRPHLEAIYEHWRERGARQREDQFSDGTLRLIALLWAVMDGDSPLFLEEPELSLNRGIVRRIPQLIHKIQSLQKIRRQFIISTHSADLLSDKSIGPEETLLLEPSNEGTKIIAAADREDIVAMLDGGMRMGEAVMPLTEPHSEQLSFL